jgi:hypothetical protein
MFHEIGHAIDWYHMMFSAKTDLGKNTVMWDNGTGITGISFSCSPAWTNVHGASDWRIESPTQNELGLWVPKDGMSLDIFYPLTGPATSCDGHDPPVSWRGTANPWEDFAECFALYMLNRNYFSVVFPKKFAALKTYLKKIKDFRREVLSK